MNPTMRVDISGFRRGTDRLRNETRAALAPFVNTRMRQVVLNAKEGTPTSTRAKIQADLGTPANPSQKAFAIVQWRKGRRGRAGVPRNDVFDKASRMIAARIRAIGSLKRAWDKALSMLGVRSGGDSRSTAIPARVGWTPEARIEVQSNAETNPILSAALRSAMNQEARQFASGIERAVEQAARKAGAL